MSPDPWLNLSPVNTGLLELLFVSQCFKMFYKILACGSVTNKNVKDILKNVNACTIFGSNLTVK